MGMKGIVLGLILFLLFPLAGVASNVEKANPRDVAQATEFLSNLPAPCGKSYMYVSEDGTVNIRLICDDGTQTTNKLVRIKDGIVVR